MTDVVIKDALVADLGLTRSLLEDTTPQDWTRVASLLRGLLDRSPVANSPRYAGERILLGAFATELEAYAIAAGEPGVVPMDLRAADVKAGEREARSRAAMRHAS